MFQNVIRMVKYAIQSLFQTNNLIIHVYEQKDESRRRQDI